MRAELKSRGVSTFGGACLPRTAREKGHQRLHCVICPQVVIAVSWCLGMSVRKQSSSSGCVVSGRFGSWHRGPIEWVTCTCRSVGGTLAIGQGNFCEQCSRFCVHTPCAVVSSCRHGSACVAPIPSLCPVFPLRRVTKATGE